MNNKIGYKSKLSIDKNLQKWMKILNKLKLCVLPTKNQLFN